MTITELNKIHSWAIPENCPVCKTELIISSSGIVTCINPSCKRKENHRFSRFFEVLDIKGAGSVFIDKIVEMDYNIIKFTKNCKNPTEDFVNDMIKAAGGINGKKIIKNTQEKIKPITIAQLLALFDSDEFNVTKLEVFNSMDFDKVISITFEELMSLNGFAEITSEAFLKFISDFKEQIFEMQEIFGLLEFKENCVEEQMVFCFTGSACLPRSKLEAMATEKGHKVSGSVNSKTTYLVTDDTESGSTKNKKAKELGIPIITSIQFCDMMQ